MRQPAYLLAPSADADGPVPQAVATDTRLRGRWLVAARVTWIVVAVVIVILDVIALPDTLLLPLSPDQIRVLHRVGFSPDLFNAIGNAENMMGMLAFLAMAVLLFARRSDDRMAYFGSIMFITFGGILGGGVFDPSVGRIVPVVESSLALRLMAATLVTIGESSLIIFFYLFPSGRFVPRWTRWCALLLLVYWAVIVAVPGIYTGPLGSVISLFLVSALIAQVYRYRRVSTPREREQTKWVVFGIVAAVLIIVVPQLIVALLSQDIQNPLYFSSPILALLWGGRWNVALLLIPVSIAVAILSSRLWDIDLIINKALVYGSLTVILAGVYIGLVFGLGTVGRGFAGTQGQQPVVIVISTLAIAALFQPLRHGIQRFIDRRFYRGKYDSARTLAAFGATLRTETDLSELSERLILAVQETMHPAHASLWLRSPTNRSARAG